jgi:hypothetical protein
MNKRRGWGADQDAEDTLTLTGRRDSILTADGIADFIMISMAVLSMPIGSDSGNGRDGGGMHRVSQPNEAWGNGYYSKGGSSGLLLRPPQASGSLDKGKR